MEISVDVYENEASILDIGSPPRSVIMSKFQYSCATGRTDLVKQSLSSASSPDDPPDVSLSFLFLVNGKQIREGYQALHLAARYGNEDIVALLLNRPESKDHLKPDKVKYTFSF